MDILSHNRNAWNKEVEKGNPWTIPVSPEQVAAARRGEWSILLTNTLPTPRDWFPQPLTGAEVLCLASGGGQQGPILAAAGAHVTVFDNSPKQLERDGQVAEREGLTIRLVQGDMADLSVFPDASFDLVINPVSTVFVPDVRPVFREAARVLRPGKALIAGFVLPHRYMFDDDDTELLVRYPLPYSDLTHYDLEQHARKFGADSAFEFSHTLDDIIGGQLDAGLMLTGFYEDGDPEERYVRFFKDFFATRAIKR